MRALILAADNFEDSELLVPYYRLLEEGIAADVAAPAKGAITGVHGYKVEANKTFAEIKPADYDILILPGGKCPETVRLNDKAVAAAKKMVESGKVVASICHGCQVLISAGVLDGRRATCWKGVRDDLKQAHATYVDEEVVVDGKLITSRWPADLPAFCREFMKALKT
jgi:protease I